MSQGYELDPYNELIRVTQGHDQTADMSFFYDSMGRVHTAESGGATALIEYDYLDRIAGVTLDGEVLASYDHERNELDILHQQDTRTGKTYTRWSSPVFGTLDSILYTRPVGLDFSHVSYVPAIKAFRVFAEIDPDVLQLASLSRRQIPLGGESVPMLPFGYDKPSNALFLPPEYQSINCYVCVYSNSGAAITVLATGDPVVGQPTDVAFVPGNQCSLVVGETPEVMPYRYGPTVELRRPIVTAFRQPEVMWSHRYNWGDGTSGIDVQSAPVVKSHTWMTEGPKTITDQFQCGCSLFWGNMSENVDVCGAQAQPPSFSYPSHQMVSQPLYDYQGNQAWGLTGGDPYSTLTCTQACDGVYRLTGAVTLETPSILVTSTVPSATTPRGSFSCAAGARTSSDMALTVGHENIHATRLTAIVNSYRQQQVMDFSTLEACLSHGANLNASFFSAYDTEMALTHAATHPGWPIHKTACMVENDPAFEIVCGQTRVKDGRPDPLGSVFNCSPQNEY